MWSNGTRELHESMDRTISQKHLPSVPGNLNQIRGVGRRCGASQDRYRRVRRNRCVLQRNEPWVYSIYSLTRIMRSVLRAIFLVPHKPIQDAFVNVVVKKRSMETKAFEAGIYITGFTDNCSTATTTKSSTVYTQ